MGRWVGRQTPLTTRSWWLLVGQIIPEPLVAQLKIGGAPGGACRSNARSATADANNQDCDWAKAGRPRFLRVCSADRPAWLVSSNIDLTIYGFDLRLNSPDQGDS